MSVDVSSSHKEHELQPKGQLVPHNLRMPGGDAITRYLHANLPLSWQRTFRDYGGFRNVHDSLVFVMAMWMPIISPSIVWRFLQLGYRLKIHRYNPYGTKDDVVEIHNSVGHQGKSDKSPILVFVHGGAWGSGKPWMYRCIADGVTEAVGASTCANMGYTVFPRSTIFYQVDCVVECLKFLHRNRSELGLGTEQPIILSGHSSGANICALALLKLDDQCLPIVQGFIPMSGVYDIASHFLWEASRGVHVISPMAAAALESGRFRESSPTQLLSGRRKGNSLALEFPKSLIIHCNEDTTVPFTSSMNYLSALKLAISGSAAPTVPTDHSDIGEGEAEASTYTYPDKGDSVHGSSSSGDRIRVYFGEGDHMTPIMNMMSTVRASTDIYKAIVRFSEEGEFYRCVSGPSKVSLPEAETSMPQTSSPRSRL
jgi:acetyl esterase/lipase